jgi:hypothetical protein
LAFSSEESFIISSFGLFYLQLNFSLSLLKASVTQMRLQYCRIENSGINQFIGVETDVVSAGRLITFIELEGQHVWEPKVDP